MYVGALGHSSYTVRLHKVHLTNVSLSSHIEEEECVRRSVGKTHSWLWRRMVTSQQPSTVVAVSHGYRCRSFFFLQHPLLFIILLLSTIQLSNLQKRGKTMTIKYCKRWPAVVAVSKSLWDDHGGTVKLDVVTTIETIIIMAMTSRNMSLQLLPMPTIDAVNDRHHDRRHDCRHAWKCRLQDDCNDCYSGAGMTVDATIASMMLPLFVTVPPLYSTNITRSHPAWSFLSFSSTLDFPLQLFSISLPLSFQHCLLLAHHRQRQQYLPPNTTSTCYFLPPLTSIITSTFSMQTTIIICYRQLINATTTILLPIDLCGWPMVSCGWPMVSYHFSTSITLPWHQQRHPCVMMQ